MYEIFYSVICHTFFCTSEALSWTLPIVNIQILCTPWYHMWNICWIIFTFSIYGPVYIDYALYAWASYCNALGILAILLWYEAGVVTKRWKSTWGVKFSSGLKLARRRLSSQNYSNCPVEDFRLEIRYVF